MDRRTFENGIVVEVEDKTVVLSGDLYMVHLEFTTSVPLDENDSELKEFCEGDRLSKTEVFKKAAVLKRDLDAVKRYLKESYFESTTKYLQHPKFVERFKQKSLADFQEEKEKIQRRPGKYEE
jgi:hypothetical protein